MKASKILALSHNHKLRLYLLGVLLYVVVLGVILVPIINKIHTEDVVKAQLAQDLKQDKLKKIAPVSGTPVAISINRLGINLPIVPGFYNPISRTWKLNSQDVFTDNNIDPNPIISTDQTRTTFLYGHDIPGILIKTSQLVYGDTMTLDTNNGYAFHYYYASSAVVPPTDNSILNQANTGNPVELMTCTGIWYQSRHVMYFHLLNVNKLGASAVADAKRINP